MEFLYLIFYACLRLWFMDVETTPSPRRLVPNVCRLLCSDVRGLAGNLSNLTVASCWYDILLCSEILVSDMPHVSKLVLSEFGPLSCCARAGCLGPEGWRHMYNMDIEHFANPSLSVLFRNAVF